LEFLGNKKKAAKTRKNVLDPCAKNIAWDIKKRGLEITSRENFMRMNRK
jgi:hypothetical protein